MAIDNTINGRTPEEIKHWLSACNGFKCPGRECPYFHHLDCNRALNADALAYIQQLERERDAAVETAMFLAGTNFAFPCESDELACSEYCEKHCNFSTSQKECWLEYFRRCGAPKEVNPDEQIQT